MRNLIFIVLINIVGILYSQKGSMTDSRDGKVYKTVLIGTQTWMAENLDVSTFRNGDPIPEAKSKEEWEKAFHDGKPIFCYKEFDSENGKKMGKIYNWFAVIDKRQLAPSGFFVPSEDDWLDLELFLGKETALKKLKSTNGWNSYSYTTTDGSEITMNGNGTDDFKFNALPYGNGYGDNGGKIGDAISFWASEKGLEIKLSNKNSLSLRIGKFSGDYHEGHYIRCLRGDDPRFKNIINNEKEVIKNKFLDQRDGKTYDLVNIGKQTWTGQNLNTVTFQNGDSIPQAKTIDDLIKAYKEKRASWCYFSFDSISGKSFGKLYNVYAISDPRKISPHGFHIPNKTEWEELLNFLGENANDKLRNSDWIDNLEELNSSGFSAEPGGIMKIIERPYSGSIVAVAETVTFSDVSMISAWWGSDVVIRLISRESRKKGKDTNKYYFDEFEIFDQDSLFYVRCIKD